MKFNQPFEIFDFLSYTYEFLQPRSTKNMYERHYEYSVISIDSYFTVSNVERMMGYAGIDAAIVLANNLPVGIVIEGILP